MSPSVWLTWCAAHSAGQQLCPLLCRLHPCCLLLTSRCRCYAAVHSTYDTALLPIRPLPMMSYEHQSATPPSSSQLSLLPRPHLLSPVVCQGPRVCMLPPTAPPPASSAFGSCLASVCCIMQLDQGRFLASCMMVASPLLLLPPGRPLLLTNSAKSPWAVLCFPAVRCTAPPSLHPPPLQPHAPPLGVPDKSIT